VRLQNVVLGQQRHGPADTGADADRQPLLVQVGVAESGVGPGLVRRDQRPRLGPVQPAQLDPVDDFARIDQQLGGDPDR